MHQIFQQSLDDFANNIQESFNQFEDQICDILEENAVAMEEKDEIKPAQLILSYVPKNLEPFLPFSDPSLRISYPFLHLRNYFFSSSFLSVATSNRDPLIERGQTIIWEFDPGGVDHDLQDFDGSLFSFSCDDERMNLLSFPFHLERTVTHQIYSTTQAVVMRLMLQESMASTMAVRSPLSPRQQICTIFLSSIGLATQKNKSLYYHLSNPYDILVAEEALNQSSPPRLQDEKLVKYVEGVVSVPTIPSKGTTQQIDFQVRKIQCVRKPLPTVPINLENLIDCFEPNMYDEMLERFSLGWCISFFRKLRAKQTKSEENVVEEGPFVIDGSRKNKESGDTHDDVDGAMVGGRPHLGIERLNFLLCNFRQHLHVLGATIMFGTRGVTSCLYFSSRLNLYLRKLAINLIPFPRWHSFMVTVFKQHVATLVVLNARYESLTKLVESLNSTNLNEVVVTEILRALGARNLEQSDVTVKPKREVIIDEEFRKYRDLAIAVKLFDEMPLYGARHRQECHHAKLCWLTMLDTLWQGAAVSLISLFGYWCCNVYIPNLEDLWTLGVDILVNVNLAMNFIRWTWITPAAISITFICYVIINALSLLIDYWAIFHVAGPVTFWLCISPHFVVRYLYPYYNVLVMDLLGLSLVDLFDLYGRNLSLEMVLMLTDQVKNPVEFVHPKSLLHRDTKISFLNHQRNDLESLGYVFMYFLRGSRPWQGLKAGTKRERYDEISEKNILVFDPGGGSTRILRVQLLLEIYYGSISAPCGQGALKEKGLSQAHEPNTWSIGLGPI